MAYRYGNRPQQLLLPPSIEDYVPADAPVRAYDAFVDALDFVELYHFLIERELLTTIR